MVESCPGPAAGQTDTDVLNPIRNRIILSRIIPLKGRFTDDRRERGWRWNPGKVYTAAGAAGRLPKRKRPFLVKSTRIFYYRVQFYWLLQPYVFYGSDGAMPDRRGGFPVWTGRGTPVFKYKNILNFNEGFFTGKIDGF